MTPNPGFTSVRPSLVDQARLRHAPAQLPRCPSDVEVGEWTRSPGSLVAQPSGSESGADPAPSLRLCFFPFSRYCGETVWRQRSAKWPKEDAAGATASDGRAGVRTDQRGIRRPEAGRKHDMALAPDSGMG